MRQIPNLVWLRTFETAARLLNFTETGRELGLTQTAVSQHMKALEGALGCRLFVRKARGLELTELGLAYLPTVRRALADIGLATTSLFGPVAKATITVKLPISTAALWLAPRLPRFAAAHPGINVRMISNIWADSAWGDDIDVEIRLGFGDWPEVSAVRVSSETVVPVVAAHAASGIKGPQDLLKGELIHILGHEDHWQRYFAAEGIEAVPEGRRYAVDTSIAALHLVAAGGGYACVLGRFADSVIEVGHRIAIAGAPAANPQAHYLVRQAGQKPPRVEALVFEDWLRGEFGAGAAQTPT